MWINTAHGIRIYMTTMYFMYHMTDDTAKVVSYFVKYLRGGDNSRY